MFALVTGVQTCALPICSLRHVHGRAHEPRQVDLDRRSLLRLRIDLHVAARLLDDAVDLAQPQAGAPADGDRKSVVLGKSETVSVDLGGRRTLKKKHTYAKADAFALSKNQNIT